MRLEEHDHICLRSGCLVTCTNLQCSRDGESADGESECLTLCQWCVIANLEDEEDKE